LLVDLAVRHKEYKYRHCSYFGFPDGKYFALFFEAKWPHIAEYSSFGTVTCRSHVILKPATCVYVILCRCINANCI